MSDRTTSLGCWAVVSEVAGLLELGLCRWVCFWLLRQRSPFWLPLSFPMTMNPDEGPISVPCNQELDCALQASFHII